MRQNINQRLNPQKTPHTSPWRASYGVSFMNILEKIDQIITAPQCTQFFIICMLRYINLHEHYSPSYSPQVLYQWMSYWAVWSHVRHHVWIDSAQLVHTLHLRVKKSFNQLLINTLRPKQNGQNFAMQFHQSYKLCWSLFLNDNNYLVYSWYTYIGSKV